MRALFVATLAGGSGPCYTRSMPDDRPKQLQRLRDRGRHGHAAARTELLDLAYERLRLLARKMFHQDFPRLGNLHETDSILHEAVLRLFRALQEVQPPTVQEFLIFSAAPRRRVLLDMPPSQGRRGRQASALTSGGAAQQ